jgi:SAM-dependent methyltransferase
MSSHTHKERTRHAFTTQADSYANSVIVAAEESRRRFVECVAPRAADRVLDVATGPGFLALLFAEQVLEVVGIDLTPAMLARAEANRVQRGLANVSFNEGDAEALPFPDASFDIATCGSAFHHFSDPRRVLHEMVRVTKRGGVVALSDIITSEHADQVGSRQSRPAAHSGNRIAFPVDFPAAGCYPLPHAATPAGNRRPGPPAVSAPRGDGGGCGGHPGRDGGASPVGPVRAVAAPLSGLGVAAA